MRVAQWYNTSQRHEILCYGGTVEFGDHIRNRLRFGHTQGLPHRYFAGSCFPQPTAFFKREALATLGGLDEDLHFTMDFDWYVRLFLQYDFTPLKHLLSWTRFHPEAETVGRFNELQADRNRIFSQLLHSLPHTQNYIQQLQHFQLYQSPASTYIVCKTFSPEDIEQIFLFFLTDAAIFKLLNYDTASCRQIFSYILNKNKDFYRCFQLYKLHLPAHFNGKQLQYLHQLYRCYFRRFYRWLSVS